MMSWGPFFSQQLRLIKHKFKRKREQKCKRARVAQDFGWLGSRCSVNQPAENFKTPENFKRPKNREDSSVLDENLIESIAAMKTIISQKMFGQIWGKNCAKTSRNRRAASGKPVNRYRSILRSVRPKMRANVELASRNGP